MPSRRESLDPRSSMAYLLAHYLHFLRTRAGLSCAGAGKVAHAARQTVSHWETGRLKPNERQAALLDEHYGTGDLLSFLLHHAKAGHNPDWFRTYLELERKAKILKIWELAVIPGILQTEEYARALFIGYGHSNVDELVRQRLSRQDLLTRENTPKIWILMAEAALELPIGGYGVLAAQLERMLEPAALPNINLRVTPRLSGAHPGLTSGFQVMRVGTADLAYTDSTGGGRLIQDAFEAESFLARWDTVSSAALPATASRDLVVQKMEAARWHSGVSRATAAGKRRVAASKSRNSRRPSASATAKTPKPPSSP